MDIDQISFGIKASAGKASTSLDRLVQSLDKLNDAFARVQTSGNGAIATLNGIVTASSGIKTGLKGASASAKTTSTAMKQVTITTRQTSNSLNTMRARLKTVGSAMVGVHRDTKTATSGMSRLIQKITQITFVVYVARRALRAFGQGIQASIAYVENLNLFMVALGENTSRATGFIKEMSESLYLDEAQLTRVQGLFYQISEALGLSSDKAYTLSENFTKLAYDLASFYNITIEDAVTKLQAGLVGETEPLRRIGIIITENNLAETARNLGIKKSIRNMTEMEKIQLRYVTALQQTKNAQGDLARTLEQPENLLRILKEQFHVLMRELGNVAIPIIKELIPQVIGLTMALADLARQMAKTLGYEAPEIRNDLGGFMKTVADESNDMEKSTDKTQKNWAKILKYTRDSASTMTGIDELNVLSDDESGFTGMGVDDLFPSADETRDQIDLGIGEYNNQMSKSKYLFDDIIQQWKDLFTEIGNIFETTKTSLKGLWEEIFGGVGSDGDRMTGLRVMNEIITGIANGATDIVKYFKELYNDILKPIFEFVAPNWMKSLQDGSFAKQVEEVFKLFVAYKITTTFMSMALHLGTIMKRIPQVALLLSTIKFGIDWSKAKSDIEKSTMFGEIINAIIAGFAAFQLTGRPELGMLVFSISLALKPFEHTSQKVEEWLSPLNAELRKWADKHPVFAKAIGFDKIIEPGTNTDRSDYKSARGFSLDTPDPKPTTAGAGGSGAWVLSSSEQEAIRQDQIDTIRDLVHRGMSADSSSPNYAIWEQIQETIKKPAYALALYRRMMQLGDRSADGILKAYSFDQWFANGGVPGKGNLFVAGEKGPELVTEHNGETVVMNEQQLKDRGISLYADGVNVPQVTKAETTNESVANLTTALDKINSDIGDGLGWLGEKIWGGLQWLGELPVFEQMKEGAKFIGKWAGKGFKVATDTASDLGTGLSGGFQAVMNTKVVKGVTEAFKNLKQHLEEGDGVLSKTYRAFKEVGKGAVTFLLNSFEKFADSKRIQQLFNPAKAPTDGTTEQQQEAMGGVIGATLGDGPAGQIFALVQHIADGTVVEFLKSAPMMIQAGMDFFLQLIDGMIEALPLILDALPAVIDSILEVLTNKESLNKIIEGLIKMVAAIVLALPDIIVALVDAIPTIITTLIEVALENLPLFFKLGVVLASAIVEGLVNIIISGINWLIKQINKIPFVNIDYLDSVDFTSKIAKNMGFAEGGFPQQGQMFIAREAGAELVGNIGGSTAVANNDQIVTAVSDGVYRAVSQAMSEQGGQRVSLRVDGRRMSEAMDLASKKRGLAFGTGGY